MRTFLQEFKEFINRGNVMDMAVGIIIGGAFTSIVQALIKNIITPLITAITGGVDNNTGLCIPIAGTQQVMDFGAFIAAIINFLLTALVVFLLMKAFNKSREMAEKAARLALGEQKTDQTPQSRLCPYCDSEVNDNALRCPNCTSFLPNATEKDIAHMNGQEDLSNSK